MIGRTNVAGGAVVVEPQMINYAMAYDAGNECADLTSGWSVLEENSGGYTLTKNAYCMKLVRGSASGWSLISTNNVVNMDGYTRVVLLYRNLSIQNSNGGMLIGTIDTHAVKSTISNQSVNSDKSGIINMDISGGSKCLVTHISNAATGDSVEITYCYMVKEDDWQTWLVNGGLTAANYSSLDAVLADANAIGALMNNENAVKYMLLNCTGTVMASVIQNNDALNAIRNSQYNAKIFANEHWGKFLRMVGEKPENEKTYLYKNGDECTEFTGGWGFTHSSGSNIDGVISLTTATEVNNSAYTRNLIDVTNYTKVFMSVVDGANRADGLSISGQRIYIGNRQGDNLAVWEKGDGKKYVADLDITNITQPVEISLNVQDGKKTCYMKVDKVWLE